MATIRDVAKEAGLSTGTVSKALSTPEKVSAKNRLKVEAAIKKLKYKPNLLARRFRSSRANTIVVMVPDIANLFFAKLISGIENVAQQAGFNVLLGDTKDTFEREEAFVRMVETRLADGLINLRPSRSCEPLLAREGVLSVTASSCENTPGVSVRIDNAAAAEKAVSYLVKLGHRRIGLVTGLKDNPHTADHQKGYCQALQAAGIEFDPALVIEGDFNFWSGISAAEQFSQLADRPTAVFCMSDEMAIAAIKGFADRGLKVPEDVSVIGFDDMEVARYVTPTLTTIAQPAEKIGERAASLLIEQINGHTPAIREHVLPYEFIIRDSVGPVNRI